MPRVDPRKGNLHCELSGRGTPVVMISGEGATGEGWGPQLGELGKDFQILTFDHRGIGRSAAGGDPVSIERMTDDVQALMTQVGWESANIVGHSMGGVIAQQLALDAPQRVRSLSLLCTFARGKDAARLTPRMVWFGLRARLGTRRMRKNVFLDRFFWGNFLRWADRDGLADRVGKVVGRDLADRLPILQKQRRALSRHDVSGRLGEFTGIPTLVVSAEHDPIAPPRYGRRLAGLIRGARYEEIAGASHGVTLQKPAVVNAKLTEFIYTAECARAYLRAAFAFEIAQSSAETVLS